LTGPLDGVARHLRRAARTHEGSTDGHLLGAFVSTRDEAAFEELLRRHGPMVLGVCRRVLGNTHDAEDAFQAAFLVLVRKAASIGRRQLVGNWLHGTAYRAALEARAARRRRREQQGSPLPKPAVADAPAEWDELRPLLDRELDRLPAKYREAVVLCDLEGRTRQEAANLLGIPEGTLSGRVTTARRMLARRLTRYGLPAIALAASSPPTLPASLVDSTTRVATVFAAGKPAAGALPAPVAALAEGVIQAMRVSKLEVMGAVLLVLALAVGGAAAVGLGGKPSAPQTEKPRRDDPSAPLVGPDQPAKLPVRHLKVNRESLPPAHDIRSLHGKSLVKVLRSADELKQLAGKKAAAELARQVDFAEEDVVLVSWVGGGKSKLAFRLVGKGKGRAVEFYVKEPPDDGKPRTLEALIGADFFAVPRGTPVRLARPREGGKDGAGRADGVPSTAPKKDDIDPTEPEIAPPIRKD
jgi:RNA polymerase sigma factor (sigma-70 family)